MTQQLRFEDVANLDDEAVQRWLDFFYRTDPVWHALQQLDISPAKRELFLIAQMVQLRRQMADLLLRSMAPVQLVFPQEKEGARMTQYFDEKGEELDAIGRAEDYFSMEK